jgi:hypothetical protein
MPSKRLLGVAHRVAGTRAAQGWGLSQVGAVTLVAGLGHEGYPYVELFTGDSVPHPHPQRRRRGLGVEPMTAPPNALQSGTDLTRLEPGAATSTSWGLLALR